MVKPAQRPELRLVAERRPQGDNLSGITALELVRAVARTNRRHRMRVETRRRPSAAGGTLFFNDCPDQCTTWAQPALSLRLGPQVQTLLSREGRPTGGCRTGQSCSRSGCSTVRDGHVGSHTSTKAPDAPAVEGDHVSWLRPARADDATQGRWRLIAPINASFFARLKRFNWCSLLSASLRD